MKVLVIGSINKDIVFDVDNTVRDGQTISSKKQSEFVGGKGFNQTVALSNIFSNVYFYCNVCEYDEQILSHMEKYNFKKEHIQKVKQQTGTAFIQVNRDGENAIVISKNANNEIDLHHLKLVLNDFNSDDLVLLQNEINDLETILTMCSDRKISIALNPSPLDGITLNQVMKTKYLIANKEEFLYLVNSTTIDEGINSFRKQNKHTHLIITLGKEGALHNLTNTTRIKGIKTTVVDTTCAGDTFLGYYLGSYLNGNDILTSLETANKAASICVQTKGASNSIPSVDTIKK